MGTSTTFTSGGSRELNLELLIMRPACALPFTYHGATIFFGAFGGPGPEKFAAFINAPVIVGYLVGLAQFAGGLAILLGALLGAICIIIVMLGAIFLVHLPNGYNLVNNGMEYALAELLLAGGLLLSGPGKLIFCGERENAAAFHRRGAILSARSLTHSYHHPPGWMGSVMPRSPSLSTQRRQEP